jgi:hypothetical protein
VSAPLQSAEDGFAHRGYAAWNRAVADVFFDGQFAHRPVYLDLEPDTLAAAAAIAGDDPESALAGLSAAVMETLYLGAYERPLFDCHSQAVRAWIDEGRTGTPPFLALLAFLSSVAEEMRSDEKFAANNYYGRLCERLDLDPEGAERDRVARWFRAETPTFWRELNGWLEASEGRLGTPTAFALNQHHKYVGVPISQALVRERDRQLLPDLFARYRLAPGTRLSRSDMLRFLEDWLPQAPASNALKALCRQPAARERVADVACIELELWDGTLPVAEGAVELDAAISLVAAFRRHPRPRVRFDLVVRSVAALPEGRYRLVDDAPPHAVAALADTDGALTLGALQPEGWRPLEESSAVSVADFLFANVRLLRDDATIRHEPRSLVILERDEELMRYVEVPRAHLAREYLLLARERLREPLDAMLAASARPGYRLAAEGEIGGLPQGWIGAVGVELMGLPETTSADLASLVPASWTAISLVSGFALPGRATWLRGALPEVVATSIDTQSELLVSLACEHLLDQEGEAPAARELGRFTEHGVLELVDLELSEGDYRLELTSSSQDTAALASAALRVRSAATPRVLLADQAGPIGHALDESPLAALAATQLVRLPDGTPVVSGAWAPNGKPLAFENGRIPTELGVLTPFEPADPDDISADAPRAGEGPSCIETGAHYIVLPPTGPERPPPGTTIEGTCKRCGLEKWFPARPRGRWGRARRPGRPASRTQPRQARAPARRPVLDVAPIEPERPASLDMLIDGLSYAQRGRWSTFEALASQVVDSGLFASESARLLSSLGHLDLILDRRTLRATSWAVAPTILVRPRDSTDAFLCGRRSGPLIDRLRTGAKALGGNTAIEELENSPALVTVRGLDANHLAELAADTSAALGWEVRFIEDAAARIAAVLPRLSLIVPQLSRFTLPIEVTLERFDVAQGRWTEVNLIDQPGAYRSRGLITRYGFADEAGAVLRETDARLCKWLAAAAERRTLLAYDEAARILVSPLGAEPPGLYERVLVLCSGRAPTKRKDGTTLYTQVPPEVAATLWRLLTS